MGTLKILKEQARLKFPKIREARVALMSSAVRDEISVKQALKRNG